MDVSRRRHSLILAPAEFENDGAKVGAKVGVHHAGVPGTEPDWDSGDEFRLSRAVAGARLCIGRQALRTVIAGR